MGFSLYLLGKHGNTEQLNEYYAKKYLKAFPMLLQLHQYPFGSHEHCYCIRTFSNSLAWLGLVKIRTEGKWGDEKSYVVRTKLFDKTFKIDL